MSLHHTQDAVCLLCEEKAKDAHPLLQEIWRELKKQFPDAHLSWTFRNEEMQELFFREGKTRARWPQSKHNVMPSLAIDVFQLRPDGVAAWPPFYFKKIADWLTEQKAPIIWGGSWHKLGDLDHLQLTPEALAQTPN